MEISSSVKRVKQEKWQGLPHMHKVKQFETVLSFKVSLFIQLYQPWKQRELVYLKKKKKNPSPNVRSAPLMLVSPGPTYSLIKLSGKIEKHEAANNPETCEPEWVKREKTY